MGEANNAMHSRNNSAIANKSFHACIRFGIHHRRRLLVIKDRRLRCRTQLHHSGFRSFTRGAANICFSGQIQLAAIRRRRFPPAIAGGVTGAPQTQTSKYFTAHVLRLAAGAKIKGTGSCRQQLSLGRIGGQFIHKPLVRIQTSQPTAPVSVVAKTPQRMRPAMPQMIGPKAVNCCIVRQYISRYVRIIVGVHMYAIFMSFGAFLTHGTFYIGHRFLPLLGRRLALRPLRRGYRRPSDIMSPKSAMTRGNGIKSFRFLHHLHLVFFRIEPAVLITPRFGIASAVNRLQIFRHHIVDAPRPGCSHRNRCLRLFFSI